MYTNKKGKNLEEILIEIDAEYYKQSKISVVNLDDEKEETEYAEIESLEKAKIRVKIIK